MKFFFMHLMPYADLDLTYSEKYDSAWVTLPNSYYDPKKGAALYNRYLDELEYADEVGFDGVCVNEHHSNAYGLMPIPGVIAGALARRTKRAKIAVLGRALPLLNNPLTVAEEYAMLDNITGGRLIAGFVRGIGAEYHSWGSNPAISHERFHEAHDLILRSWTETGPFPFEGKHYHFNYVNVWPRVYQQPHPPIWIPSQGSRETIEWASDASRRYTYLQTFSPVAALKKYMEMYKEQAERNGYTATPQQLGWSVPTYVAETDEQAYREAKPHIETMVNKFLRMRPEMLLPPGYSSVESMKGMLLAKKAVASTSGGKTIDELIKSGIFLCGSAATVRDQILHYQKEIGFGTFISLMQFGTLPHELTLKSTRTFAQHVIPALRDVGEPAAETAAA
ncbi:Alkanesulfonate monooxygenase [Paraburkholderia hiiakae]|uniref:Alkanesulfonate monooxygenase n=1 Tax=Paraburkholderia hiiakae TaxID=1081782 RepID=A0ABN7IGZ9_9BURK|nr:LLM class flavin-dependent oxidoreductase [Paraburkholderia hiiakae]CAD6559440.1 Alkanesulfonate monooxygenase [Paraburkholderia hiiakae]